MKTQFRDMDCAYCEHSIQSHVHVAPHPCDGDDGDCVCKAWVWERDAEEYLKSRESES